MLSSTLSGEEPPSFGASALMFYCFTCCHVPALSVFLVLFAVLVILEDAVKKLFLHWETDVPFGCSVHKSKGSSQLEYSHCYAVYLYL